MCLSKSFKKLFVLSCVILVASSGLWAFGWERSKAPATPVITPTETVAPATDPAVFSAPSSEQETTPESQPSPILVIAESKSSDSNPSVTNALQIMDALLSELESSKKTSKEAMSNLSSLQNELVSANANFEAYKAEAEKVMEEKKELAHEVNRLHLGLGFGASYAPLEDLENFGMELDLSLRKGSIMLLAGVEYPDMMNVLDFDYSKLRVKGSVIYEF